MAQIRNPYKQSRNVQQMGIFMQLATRMQDHLKLSLDGLQRLEALPEKTAEMTEAASDISLGLRAVVAEVDRALQAMGAK